MFVTTLNPRQVVIHLCLIGMEIAWFTPFILFLYQFDWAWAPLAIFGFFSLWLLGWMVVILGINRLSLTSPTYELLVGGAIILGSLLFISIWPYRLMAMDVGGVRHLFQTLLDWEQGLPAELYLILINLFLWQRASAASSRELGFFMVALNFRLGLLLLIGGGGLYTFASGQSLMSILCLYFGLGLSAIALARIEEKAVDARSVGKILPWRRLVQLILIILITVGGVALISSLYTPEHMLSFLFRLEPVWAALALLVPLIAWAIFWVLEPFLVWLQVLLADIFTNFDLNLDQLLDPLVFEEGTESTEQTGAIAQAVPDWAWISLRCVILSVIFMLIVGFILLFLNKMRAARNAKQDEDTNQEALSLGGNLLKQGANRLKDMVKLIGKYGLGRNLLAAISVENIYANLCRLASQRNYPRPPAQPPDDYLPTLSQAFAEQNEALARITAAYMRVHYGDRPVTPTELAQLKADYQQVRQAKPVQNQETVKDQ